MRVRLVRYDALEKQYQPTAGLPSFSRDLLSAYATEELLTSTSNSSTPRLRTRFSARLLAGTSAGAVSHELSRKVTRFEQDARPRGEQAHRSQEFAGRLALFSRLYDWPLHSSTSRDGVDQPQRATLHGHGSDLPRRRALKLSLRARTSVSSQPPTIYDVLAARRANTGGGASNLEQRDAQLPGECRL